jgi:hypothetical protein
MSRLRIAGAGAAIVGAAVSAELAWLHARELSAFGVICGGTTIHCGWCVSTIALAGLAVAALVSEARARRAVAAVVRSDRRG